MDTKLQETLQYDNNLHQYQYSNLCQMKLPTPHQVYLCEGGSIVAAVDG